jgi:hypothetical protein
MSAILTEAGYNTAKERNRIQNAVQYHLRPMLEQARKDGETWAADYKPPAGGGAREKGVYTHVKDAERGLKSAREQIESKKEKAGSDFMWEKLSEMLDDVEIQFTQLRGLVDSHVITETDEAKTGTEG